MTDLESVLEFDHLAVGADESVGFVLRRGDLARIRAADMTEVLSLANMAQGLAIAVTGVVRFLGQDWRELTISQSSALRGRMGRISPEYGWISNLDLEENITLSQRHSTRRPPWEIRAEARRWAQAFGLPDGIPPGRPSEHSETVLRRAACVRAFLGDPAMIVIATPGGAEWAALHRPLVDACHFLRGRKAAVLWMTHQQDSFEQIDVAPTIELSLATEATALVPQTN